MKRNKDCKRLLFVLNKNHNVTRFLSKVCRTGQNMIFTHQQSRPSQDVFIDNVGFSDMQRNRPQQVPFAVTFSEKEQTEKFPFQQQKTELHQLFEGLLSIFFFLRILRYSRKIQQKKKPGNSKAFCVTSKRNQKFVTTQKFAF